MSPSVSVRLLLTQSDARLVALAGEGHERAFEALVQRYRRPLLSYCRRLLLPDERAEDALQQALMQAWLALQRGVEVIDARSWLYRIVHNAALNMLRVSGYDYCTLSDSLSGADAPQADLDRRIAVREALAGLAALPEMQRQALLRTAVEGASHAQAAHDLGVSETALRGLVYRARATLRTAVTAITPPPLLGWALGASARTAPLAERIAGAGAGGGSAGLAGLALKGGAVVVTAGTLAGGIVVHAHSAAVARARERPAGLTQSRQGAPGAQPNAGAGLRDAAYTAHSPRAKTLSNGRFARPHDQTQSTTSPGGESRDPSHAPSPDAPRHEAAPSHHHDSEGQGSVEDKHGETPERSDRGEPRQNTTTGSSDTESASGASGTDSSSSTSASSGDSTPGEATSGSGDSTKQSSGSGDSSGTGSESTSGSGDSSAGQTGTLGNELGTQTLSGATTAEPTSDGSSTTTQSPSSSAGSGTSETK
jgi:RNA polymerase sigma factor (sigma-70 family)